MGGCMHRSLRPIALSGLLLGSQLLATAALAQTSEGLSPTLTRIKNAHVVRLGYRESSPPFSFLDQANRPIGYSLELCEAVVDEIGVEVDDPSLKIEYVKVTSDDRIQAVLQDKIDLECGSTTANADRAKKAALNAWREDPRPRVSSFVADCVRRLDQQIAAEQRSAERRKEQRRLDFDGNDEPAA